MLFCFWLTIFSLPCLWVDVRLVRVRSQTSPFVLSLLSNYHLFHPHSSSRSYCLAHQSLNHNGYELDCSDSPLCLIVKNIVRARYDGFTLTKLMQEDWRFQGQPGLLRGSQNKGPSFYSRYMNENSVLPSEYRQLLVWPTWPALGKSDKQLLWFFFILSIQCIWFAMRPTLALLPFFLWICEPLQVERHVFSIHLCISGSDNLVTVHAFWGQAGLEELLVWIVS